jgi:uncharacterized protein YjbJ (UPF0337 family)
VLINLNREITIARTTKIDNAKQHATGKLKEVAGEVTGNDELRREGENDQTKANLKQAGEKVKDAFKK